MPPCSPSLPNTERRGRGLKNIFELPVRPTSPAADAAFALYFELLANAEIAEQQGNLRMRLDILSQALLVLSQGMLLGIILRTEAPLMAEMRELYQEVERLRALLGPPLPTETRGGTA